MAAVFRPDRRLACGRLLVPRVKPSESHTSTDPFPDFLAHRFGEPTRLVAALVSAIGYAGFTGSQLLAGGKLASAAFEFDLTTAVLVMSVVIVVYTALGGLQAVIYTDTIQWIILFVGFIGPRYPFRLSGSRRIFRSAQRRSPQSISRSTTSPFCSSRPGW